MIIEVSTFRLAEGVTEDVFLAADAAVQTDFFHLQPGILRRTTARGDEGTYAAVSLWSSMDDALSTERVAPSDPVARAFAELTRDVRVERYESLD